MNAISGKGESVAIAMGALSWRLYPGSSEEFYQAPAASTGKKIAVVGSGPSGPQRLLPPQNGTK
jgi:NADPH-dependent glutamate synthase beta subunit-like oxidoreductase